MARDTNIRTRVSPVALWAIGIALWSPAYTMPCLVADEKSRFPLPFLLKLDEQSPTSLNGIVVDHNGQPVANANVAVFAEHPDFLVPTLSPTVLCEADTDDEGRFSARFGSPTPYQCTRIRAIAGKAGHGFCVLELVLTKREQVVRFQLKNERVVHGRALGPDGQPVAGLRVQLRSFHSGTESVSLGPGGTLPAVWPNSATSDENGRFAIEEIPESQTSSSLTLEVDDERFAPQRTKVHIGRDRLVELRVSDPGIVSGLVVKNDTGAPIAGCWLLVVTWDFQQTADNQHEGLPVLADANGRFRIRCKKAKYIVVYAYPPMGTPYLAWVTDATPWPEGNLRQELRVEVPRGLLIHGRIIESESKEPVAGAGIEYCVARSVNPHVSRGFADKAYWAAEYRRVLSREDGTFEVAVIPGPGYLLAKAPDERFVSQQITAGELQWGRPGGYYLNFEAVRRIDPGPDDKTVDVVLEMRRGVTIRGRVEGPDGQPVEYAVLRSKSFTRIQSVFWDHRRHFPIVDGRFELPGCDPDQPRTVFILDARNQWGATVTLDPKEASEETPLIRLGLCGSATVRLIDKQGRALANQHLQDPRAIFRLDLIGKEGPVNPSFGTQANRHIGWASTSLDRLRYRPLTTDKDGQFTFPTLVPNAPYRLVQLSPRFEELFEFKVEAGGQRALGTITIE